MLWAPFKTPLNLGILLCHAAQFRLLGSDALYGRESEVRARREFGCEGGDRTHLISD